jgi:diacylglycerol kinase family enzyme
MLFTALQSFPMGVASAVGVVAAGVAAVEGLQRRSSLRAVLVVVAVVLAAGSIGLLVAEGLLLELAVAIVLVAVIALSGRRAFEPVPELQAVEPPRHPVVIWNPKSGGGKALSNNLAAEAAARGIEAIELQRGDDIVQLVNDAVARGADALAAAGGDGTQALVATIAAERDLPFACIPAGTRNHFALDLGVDRDDVVGALDALVNGLERRVDLAEINGRVFVNNVSLGVYASAVQRDEYRDAKISTLLDTVPDVIGTTSTAASELRWVSPDGTTHGSTAVLLVSNNPYRMGTLIGSGTRPKLDDGVLGIIATRERGNQASGSRFRLWSAWQQPTFTVESDQPVPVGVDGEALVMEPPLEFRIRPRALRVRIAPQHPGASPSSGTPTGPLDAWAHLARIAAGKPGDT